MQYAFNLTKNPEGGYEATSPDIPEMSAGPFETEEAFEQYISNGGLQCILHEGFRSKRKAIPLPCGKGGAFAVYVPLRLQAKIQLWNWMIENRYRIVDLAKALGIPRSQAGRYVDLLKDQASIDAIENALKIMGGVFCLATTKKKA